MNKLTTLILSGFLAVTASANNNNITGAIGEINSHALAVQKSAEWISQQLKSKQPDAQQLEQRLATVDENIGKLKDLVAGLEASHPSLTATQQQHWDKMKMKVDLLAVFANVKKDLLSKGELEKNRNLLRAHANGIAKRAVLLQQTAAKVM